MGQSEWPLPFVSLWGFDILAHRCKAIRRHTAKKTRASTNPGPLDSSTSATDLGTRPNQTWGAIQAGRTRDEIKSHTALRLGTAETLKRSWGTLHGGKKVQHPTYRALAGMRAEPSQDHLFCVAICHDEDLRREIHAG